MLKYAAYYLGSLAGHHVELSLKPNFEAALTGHWSEAYFHQLNSACKAIAPEYGAWRDHTLFEVIGDIADDIVAERRILCTLPQNGRLYLGIPFTPETMPYAIYTDRRAWCLAYPDGGKFTFGRISRANQALCRQWRNAFG